MGILYEQENGKRVLRALVKQRSTGKHYVRYIVETFPFIDL